MKRRLLFFAGFAAALSILAVGITHAANVRSGDSPFVMSGETIDGSLYAAGKTIKMDGTVKGDVFCLGQDVDITGTVEGDVICAAQTLTISGHVEGSVRVAAQMATLSGKVDGSVSVGAMQVQLATSGSVGHDLSIAAQQATVDGTVGRDVAAAAETYNSAGSVTRNLDVHSPAIALSGEASVGGNFIYTSDAAADMANTVHITGSTQHLTPPKSNEVSAITAVQAYIITAVFGFASMIVTGLGILAVSPRAVGAVNRAQKTAALSTFGLGVVGLFIVPLIALALFITIIGIALSGIVFLGWLATLIAGATFSAITVGGFIMEKMHWNDKWNHFGSLVLGALTLSLLALVPYVGIWISIFAMVWGVGGIWSVVFNQRRMSMVAKKES